MVFEKYDVVGVRVTWLIPVDGENVVSLPGYNFHRKIERIEEGVVVYISSSSLSEIFDQLQSYKL